MMALKLQYQTPAEFAARLRGRFRNSDRIETSRMAAWVIRHLQLGDFTERQIQTAFGLTLTQWSNLKTRLKTLRTNYLAVQAARGE